MRAVYLEQDFELNQELALDANAAHHLNNVLRVKLDQEILGLNGKGQTAKLRIVSIKKRAVIVLVQDVEEHTRSHQIDLFIGRLKKEAMDLVFKQACELGINKIFILDTEYSQKNELKEERVKKLLISGIEQSNNPFIPDVTQSSFAEIDLGLYEKTFFFSLNDQGQNESVLTSDNKIALVIGPEGGLSSEEESKLISLNAQGVRLPSYILRAPTAVACASGYIFNAIRNIDALN